LQLANGKEERLRPLRVRDLERIPDAFAGAVIYSCNELMVVGITITAVVRKQERFNG
jgi:hypothetical protein